MAIEYINPMTLKKMFISGANYLQSRKKYIDELNVFPVPDGDTGTNMSLTVVAAVKEVLNCDTDDMKQIAKAISSGSLRGARGNSGVILSQLFRGFAKVIGEHEKINTTILANAMKKGAETAYKAVMKPQEGTILTVAREAAEKAVLLAADSNDLLFVMKETLKHAEDILQKTPDMLPVLKEAGVVDAGGEGLLCIFKGALIALESGEEVEVDFDMVFENETKIVFDQIDGEIKFGYCTEFIINANNASESEEEGLKLRTYLESVGDSIVVVSDEEIIKIHVHTNDPGKILQQALTIGELVNIKIDNMRQQHSSRVITEEQVNKENEVEQTRKEFGFVVVSIGSGLNDIFKGLGADYIIEGGQTMNPSTEDLLNAIDKVNAENIFILPNNKNIILAAKQASKLCKNKNVIVIPSKSIPQGISAIISFEHKKSADENFSNMQDGMSYVDTGQLTFAVRDTSIQNKAIKEGDILGIGNGEILTVEEELDSAAKSLINHLVDNDSELVTIYYGEDIDETRAMMLADYIEEQYEDCDVEVHYGGQPLYYYILSVE